MSLNARKGHHYKTGNVRRPITSLRIQVNSLKTRFHNFTPKGETNVQGFDIESQQCVLNIFV
jgi:hypothetical protein